MKCCSSPNLMDEIDKCGCIHVACFSCNEYTIVQWCKLHDPEGEFL